MKLSFIFTDHAVLQREKPIKLWGEGKGVVSVELAGNKAESECKNGNFEIVLPAMHAGGPYELTVCDSEEKITLHDIMIGEVWIAGGQSNMEQPVFATEGGFEAAARSNDDMLRLFTVPRRTSPGELKYSWHFESVYSADTPWQVSCEENVLHFSAVGYYFAASLRKKLGVAVGVISCNVGGTRAEAWLDENKLEKSGIGDFRIEQAKDSVYWSDSEEYKRRYIKYRDEVSAVCQSVDALGVASELGPAGFARADIIKWPPETDFGPYDFNWAGVFYRNMVMRIAPIAVRGVIWYQGESNRSSPEHYLETFGLVTESWRELWQDKLPFLTVQIAPFKRAYSDDWAVIMEQQALAEKTLENVRMVTSSDIGEEDNIHPINKKPIGDRLFAAAMTECYGEPMEYSGPVYSHSETEGNVIRIYFDHAAGGLMCDGEVSGLFVCGSDGKYAAAYGAIEGNTLLVLSPEIKAPVAARMEFGCYPQVNLKNSYGITAAPFRTDKNF